MYPERVHVLEKGKSKMKVFKASNIFSLFVLLAMATAVLAARNYHLRAAIYPIVVGTLGCIISIILLVRNFTKGDAIDNGGVIDIEKDTDVPDKDRLIKAGKAFAAVLTLYLLIWLLGFKLGALVFVIGFVAIEAHAKWYLILGLSVSLAFVLIVFKEILNVFWPEGLLGEWLAGRLPWLF